MGEVLVYHRVVLHGDVRALPHHQNQARQRRQTRRRGFDRDGSGGETNERWAASGVFISINLVPKMQSRNISYSAEYEGSASFCPPNYSCKATKYISQQDEIVTGLISLAPSLQTVQQWNNSGWKIF